ncbi:hypothetical protein CLU79DRAFT_702116 [Phycomyces nitens]|nr:hypothetical protein CLU79DRAFT_702116 [Phycomyces nitens]
MVFVGAPLPEPIPVISGYDLLFTNARNLPLDRKVFIDNDNVDNFITYGGLVTQVTKFSSGLQQIFNIQRGDVVAVCSPNQINYPVAMHGIVAAGGIACPVEHSLPTDLLVKDLQVVRPKLLIAHKHTLNKCLEAAKIIGLPKSHILLFGPRKLRGVMPYKQILYSYGVTRPPVKLTEQEILTKPAFLYFTSGTSGVKKAVMMSQFNVNACLMAKDAWSKVETRAVSHVEFHHASALIINLHYCIMHGVETFLLHRYNLRDLCNTIQKYKVGLCASPPWTITYLVKDPTYRSYDLSSLNVFICTGAFLDNSSARAFYDRFGIPVINKYAMTENTCFFKTILETVQVGSLGVVQDGNILKIIGDDGQEVGLDEMGELCVKGPTVAQGYYLNPVKTAEAFDHEGFFHTGDLVRRDENGRFFYVDRSKDLIKYLLNHICPGEIEDILMTHPLISECSVIGIYSTDLATEMITAFVVLVPGTEKTPGLADELCKYANSQLIDLKHLRGGVRFLEKFPRTAAGKILRAVIRMNAIEEDRQTSL